MSHNYTFIPVVTAVIGAPNCIFLCVLLLIPCKTIALQVSQSNELSDIFEKIEKVLDDDPTAAFNLLAPLEDNLSEFSLEERIRFYKIQAEIYIERLQYQLGKKAAIKGLELAKQLTTPSILMADLSYLENPLLIFLQIANYDLFKEFYSETLMHIFEFELEQVILNYFPANSGLNKVYNLSNTYP